MSRLKQVSKELWSCYLGFVVVFSCEAYLYFMYQFKMAGLW